MSRPQIVLGKFHLNTLVEWRSHFSAEGDEDGNVIDKRVQEGQKTEDGDHVSHTDPASGFGIQIAAAMGDGTGKLGGNGFQRGHLASKIELGTAETGPHAEIVALVQMAVDCTPGLAIGADTDSENSIF